MQKYNSSNEPNIILKLHLIVLLLLIFGNVFSQQSSVSGRITDSQNGDPIPYVNISIKHSTMGTISDTLGYYILKQATITDTLNFSAVGYYSFEKDVKELEKLKFIIHLKPYEIDISQIDVNVDEEPVRKLLKEMIKKKSYNNPDKYNKFSYRKYTKWEYQINNVDEKIINSYAFKNKESLFKTAENGSKFLPLYFSEQIVFNEVQRSPAKQKSTVIADKTMGVGMLGELEISGYTSALDMEVNFYDNFINLFTQNFVSPVSDNGWFFYKYYLVDSTLVDDIHQQYLIHFRPRRNGENTFRGYFIVENKHYSLIEVDGDLSNTSSLNFMKSLHLKSNYAFVNDSTPFYKRTQMDALFDYVPFKNPNKQPERLSLFYTQTSSIDEVTINQEKEIKLSTANANYETIKLPGAYIKDDLYWEKNRMEALTENDILAKLVIDSVTQIKSIKTINNLAGMSMTGYYDLGKIELGPFTNFFNTNEIEGIHLFMGGRTSEEISSNIMVWGGLGYGTLNKKFNGIAGIGFKLPTKYRQVLKLSYDDKMIRHGENEKILNLYENSYSATENNLMSQVLKHDVLNEIFREQKTSASYDYEWYPGLSNKLTLNYTKHYSPQFYPFEINGKAVNSVSAFEIKLNTRFSKEEKLIDKGFLRMFMGTEHPIVHFTVGGGKTFYNQQSNFYGLIAATLKHEALFGLTRLDYAIETGAFFGKLPYTMLDIPRGNETMGYYLYDFNMLGYLEYVHDKYIHGYFQYHFNGFFFRRVPFLYHANLREVISARVMLGSLSPQQQQVISLPSSISKMQNPYIEVGAGVENILSLLHIEAVWRLTPPSIIGSPTFGIRVKLDMGL